MMNYPLSDAVRHLACVEPFLVQLIINARHSAAGRVFCKQPTVFFFYTYSPSGTWYVYSESAY